MPTQQLEMEAPPNSGGMALLVTYLILRRYLVLKKQWRRFLDYRSIGVPHVVKLDPKAALTFRCQERARVETSFTELELPTGRLPLDSTPLFQQLAAELIEE
jgi:hypothetical protein